MSKDKKKSVAEKAELLLRSVIEDMGYILWDVEYKKEGSDYNLILTIDREGDELTLDDCAAVTEAVNPILDEADPIPDSYCLEVSSAGLERELKRPEHFAKYIGKEVEVKLFAPTNELPKLFTAVLESHDGGVTVLSVSGESTELEDSKIAGIKNLVDYKEIFKKDK